MARAGGQQARRAGATGAGAPVGLEPAPAGVGHVGHAGQPARSTGHPGARPAPACAAPRQAAAGAGPHRQSAAGAGAAARTRGAFCLGRAHGPVAAAAGGAIHRGQRVDAGVAAPFGCRRWHAATGPRRKAQSAANTASIGKDCNAARWGDGKWQPACEGWCNTSLHQHPLAGRALVPGAAGGAARLGGHHCPAPRLAQRRGARLGRGGAQGRYFESRGVHIEPGPGRGLFAGGAGAADRLGQGRGAAGAARGPIRPRAGAHQQHHAGAHAQPGTGGGRRRPPGAGRGPH